ncbi:MAG: glucose-6-phosphate dehydrogenase assembly protein OpcA [Acidobacteria bacterium]|nr:glucose-6-phosphate dehydrogenase assembly protein OpcA [Acidobacteriota bacterium]
MQESTFHQRQIPVATTLDVQAVEDELNELWMQSAGESASEEEGAMLRARVLNLMALVASEEDLSEVNGLLLDVAEAHPCRALLMYADAAGEDKDIEMEVSSRCKIESGAGGRHLCCEQVTLRASGRFAVELPSAAAPLLISDLPSFLWWRAAPHFESELFKNLRSSADRVVIDSATFLNPYEDLRRLASFLSLGRKERESLSDLNWARLTPWRALVAGFYDAPQHREALSRLSRVRVEYIALKDNDDIAPKALLLAGWLASRLGWRASASPPQLVNGARLFSLEQDGRAIVCEFVPAEHTAVAPGGLARVELMTESEPQVSFIAMRAEDSRELKTQEATNEDTQTTRVVACADASEAQLLSGELGLLSRDRIYEEAVAQAAAILNAL